MGLLSYDNFNRADSATGSPGGPWTDRGTSGSISGKKLVLASQTGYLNRLVYKDIGTSDQLILARTAVIDSNSIDPCVVLRYDPVAQTGYMIEFAYSYFVIRQAGSAFVEADFARPSQAYDIIARIVGSTLTATVIGVTDGVSHTITATNTAITTGTCFGLTQNDGGNVATFDWVYAFNGTDATPTFAYDFNKQANTALGTIGGGFTDSGSTWQILNGVLIGGATYPEQVKDSVTRHNTKFLVKLSGLVTSAEVNPFYTICPQLSPTGTGYHVTMVGNTLVFGRVFNGNSLGGSYEVQVPGGSGSASPLDYWLSGSQVDNGNGTTTLSASLALATAPSVSLVSATWTDNIVASQKPGVFAFLSSGTGNASFKSVLIQQGTGSTLLGGTILASTTPDGVHHTFSEATAPSGGTLPYAISWRGDHPVSDAIVALPALSGETSSTLNRIAPDRKVWGFIRRITDANGYYVDSPVTPCWSGLPKYKIMLAGDSVVAQMGTRVSTLAAAHNITTVNYGASGSYLAPFDGSTAMVWQPGDSTYEGYVATVIADGTYTHASIRLTLNDIKSGVLSGAFCTLSEGLVRAKTALNILIADLLGRVGMHGIILELPTFGQFDLAVAVVSDEHYAAQAAVRDMIQSVINGTTVLAGDFVSTDLFANLPLLFADEVHLTSDGYDVLASNTLTGILGALRSAGYPITAPITHSGLSPVGILGAAGLA